MASPLATAGMAATPPMFSLKGAHNSLLLEMTGLGKDPASGRLLRGLTPYLDEQGADHVILLTERRRRESWRPGDEEVITYQELVYWERRPDGGVYRGVVSKDARIKREEILQAFELEPLAIIDWAARRMGTAVIASNAPLVLESCIVPKPWGREVWYTGIESRGVSRVLGANGSVELPYALCMFPVPLIGEKEVPPVLLKTLDPLPDPLYGDLYLEVHREKWETYMVLAVDQNAWPDGVGYLRAGIDPKLVEKASSEHIEGEAGMDWKEILAARLETNILAYETIRREIDAHLDQVLRNQGEDPDLPVRPELHRELVRALPQAQRSREEQSRAEVEVMLGKIPLRPGDVVTLPPGVLHSLQHGVKVIEFQTPTYERLIAMFAQKVLTQPHWDTSAAIAAMEMAPYVPPQPKVLVEKEGRKVEMVVDFPQFQVHRTHLELNLSQPGQTEGHNRYKILFIIAGKGELELPGGVTFSLEPESAFLLPAKMGAYTLHAISAQGLTYLEASPAKVESTEPVAEEAQVEEILARTW